MALLRVTLIVSGGIAAYKTPDLVRLLTKSGADVQVVLTENAAHFVAPRALQVLSGKPVAMSEFVGVDSHIGHIQIADRTDVLLVAPATANIIAKLTHGIADDLPTTIALAYPSTKPLLIAPAMNVNMWQHPATQDNIATLKRRGATMVGPESGELACGWTGPGRMSEPASIVEGCWRRYHGRTEGRIDGPTTE